MNKFAKEWIEALKSEDYKQYRGGIVLVYSNGDCVYCCLGVAQKLHGKLVISREFNAFVSNGLTEDHPDYEYEEEFITSDVKDLMKMKSKSGTFQHDDDTREWFSKQPNIKEELSLRANATIFDIANECDSLYKMNDEKSFNFKQIAEFVELFEVKFFDK